MSGLNLSKGWVAAILTVAIFSTNTPIARTVIKDGMHPLTLSGYRFMFAGVIFAGIYFLSPLVTPKNGEAELDKRIIWICLVSGGINGITLSAYYGALSFMDAGLTSVLGIALFPTITLLILAAYGEALNMRKIIRLSLVMIGLYFLLGFSGALEIRGVGLVVIAATTYATHVVSVQWYLKPYNIWGTTSIMMMGAAIVVFVLWSIAGMPAYVPGVRGWLVVAYQVVLLTLIGRYLTYFAINEIGSGQMALFTPVETVLTVIWSMLFLSERLVGEQWIGAGLILVSALLAADFKKRQSPIVT